MTDGDNKKGFSGLDSLVTDVDKGLKDAERTSQGQGSGQAQSSTSTRPQSQPKPASAQPSRRPAPPPPVDSGSGGKNVWLWVLGGFILFVVWAASQDGGSSRTTSPSSTSYTPPTTSRSQTSPALPTLTKPPVGTNHIHSSAEIRYCLAEEIRLEALEPRITANSQIDAFNSLVSDYNSRCGSYRYRQGGLAGARRAIEPYRSVIVANAWTGLSLSSTAQRQPSRPPVQRSQLTMDIQNALTELGYQPGTADGIFGPRTKSAIQAFQRDIGVSQDGMATRQLLDRINAELSSRQRQGASILPAPVRSLNGTPNQRMQASSVQTAIELNAPSISPREQAAIENTCGWRRSSRGPTDYRNCVAAEEAELSAIGPRPTLASLSATNRTSIENTCGWRKNSRGPDDYYTCLSQEIAKLRSVSSIPDMSTLSSADRNAIENTCDWRKNSRGPADYYQCLQQQINQLARSRARPDLSVASATERSAIENTCDWRKNSRGPADYYDCVEQQVSALAKFSWRPNFSGVSHSDRQAIENACGWRKNSRGPVDYYECVRQQIRLLN